LKLAHRTPDLQTHGFYNTAEELWSQVKDHINLFADNPDVQHTQMSLRELLLFRDSRITFAALWMLLVPENLEPKETNFAEWDWPRVDLEFDHRGQFIPLADDHFCIVGAKPIFWDGYCPHFFQ